MKRLALLIFLSMGLRLYAQQNAVNQYPAIYYQRGLELFDEKKYNAAITQFQLFIEKSDNTGLKSEAEYYQAIAKLYAEHGDGEAAVIRFLEKNPGSHKTHMANLALGDYYYLKRKYSTALKYYKLVDPSALTRADHNRFFFRKGYCEIQRRKYKDAQETLFPLTQKENEYKTLATYYYGYCALYNNDLKEALRAFKNVEDDGPKMVRFYIAQIYYMQGDYDKSLSYLDKFSAGVPNSLLNLIKGKNHYRKADFAKAAEFFNKTGYSKDSLQLNEIYEFGYANYKTSNYGKAADWLKLISFQGDSMSQIASYNLADCYLKLNKKREAMNAFAEAYRSSFNHMVAEDALFNQAKVAVELDESNAASLLQKFIDNYPKSKNVVEAKKLLARLMLNTDNYRDAVAVLESIGELDAQTEESYQRVTLARGMELFKSKQWNDAIAMFDKCMGKKASRVLVGQAAFWKAESLMQQNDWKNAGSNYQKFLDAPGVESYEYYPFAYYGIGYVKYKQTDYAEALPYFEKFEKLGTRGKYDEKIYSDAQLRLGDCNFMQAGLSSVPAAEKQKKLAKAVDAYSYVSGKRGADADYAMFQTGNIYGLQKQREKKIATMKRLVADYPRSSFIPDAYFELGVEYLALGNKKEAERYFMYVVDDFKGNALVGKAYATLGRMYYNDNQDNKAIDMYTKLYDEFPGTADAKAAAETVKRIYTENGRTAEYFDWVKSRGGISASAQDSLLYVEGFNYYEKTEYNKAITSFQNYLDKMRNGSYVISANYYKAICHETLKQKDKAIEHYKVVANANGSEYQEDALLTILQLYGPDGPCEDLLPLLEKLEVVTKSKETRQQCWQAEFRCFDKLNRISDARNLANRIIDDYSAPDELKSQALVVLGRADMQDKKYKNALDRFNEAYSKYNNIYAAEAKYREAQVYYETQDYEACINSCYDELDQFNAYDWWVGKSMILLGDAYLAKGDEFNAKATWNSVVDNFGAIKEISNEAKDRLAKLKNKTIKSNLTEE
ncbi:MAG: tetratricopeptide repeat protein [Bacteroidia bacterium]|nr:tetratricopeptide repeat protein [Bacteroidia bacterium]